MRINGFTRPFSKHQISVLAVQVFTTSVYLALFIPNVSEAFLRVAFYLYCPLLVAVITGGTLATGIDPIDPAAKTANGAATSAPVPGSNSKYCRLCRARVQPSTRHCRTCGRCTLRFDHHCVWLNNCIGAANYGWFLFLILALEGLSAVQVYAGTIAMHSIATRDNHSSIFSHYDFGDSGFTFFAVLSVATATSVVMGVADGGLVLFHGYLRARGITTMDCLIEMKRAKVHPLDFRNSGSSASRVLQVGAKPDASEPSHNLTLASIPVARKTHTSLAPSVDMSEI